MSDTIAPVNELVEQAPPGPGHNLTIFDHDAKGNLRILTDVLRELMLEENMELLDRKEELLGAVARAPLVIGDPETAERMVEQRKQIRAARAAAEARRVGVKRPFLDAERAVDGFFTRDLVTPLDRANATLGERLTVWERKVAEEERKRLEEIARQQAEEAARLEAEAQRLAAEAREREADATTETELQAAIETEQQANQIAEHADQARLDLVSAEKVAAAKPAELSRIRTTGGAVSSLRTFWDFDPKTINRATLDWQVLAPHISTECLEKAIRSLIRAGGRECGPDLKIFQNTKAT